jgi:hypothetical protein
MNAYHWHSEPDKTTRRFAQKATFRRTMGDLQAAIEVTAHEDGAVSVVSSEIVPVSGTRTIVQESALMFHDMDEAKDAVDLILDRLAGEAGGELASQEAEEVSRGLVLTDAAEPELARILAPLSLDPPATDDVIEHLVRHVSTTYSASLPEDYLAFLRTANGADGDLENGAPVVFWKAELLPRISEDAETEQWMPGMFIIGSDAGDALYGIDMREDAPPERYVETFDVMEWDSVMWRGRSFLDLLLYLGRPLDSPKLGGFGRLLRGLRKPRT